MASGPQAQSNPDEFAEVLALGTAARQAGADVGLFLMDEGVLHANTRTGSVQALLPLGWEITVCAMDAETHGLSMNHLVDSGIVLGAQSDHGLLLKRSARFVAYTGSSLAQAVKLQAEYLPEPPFRKEQTVLVLLTHTKDHPKTTQALRTALGYVSVGLQVTVGLAPAALPCLAMQGAPTHPLRRPLGLLSALGQELVPYDRNLDQRIVTGGFRAVIIW